jgi:hypothetical protein
MLITAGMTTILAFLLAPIILIGERYTAKFYGNFYSVEDDPGHTMVSAKLLNAQTVDEDS